MKDEVKNIFYNPQKNKRRDKISKKIKVW